VFNANNTGEAKMRHAKLVYPKPNVHLTHPYRHQGNHEELLRYIQARLWAGKESRDSEIPRLVKIDRKVAGWIRQSEEDKKRQAKIDSTGEPLMTKMNLPLAFIHLDDMMTFYAQTFAPNRGMFYHTGRPQEVGEANQIVTKMNNDALYSGYFREVLLGIFSLLKYNCGGFHTAWGRENGPKIVETPGGSEVQTELKWQGNRLEAIDRYNFLCDPSVHPTKLHVDGEFAATVKVRSHFWLQMKASQGAFFNCESAIGEWTDQRGIMTYYRHPPEEAMFQSGNNTGVDDGAGPNWVAILSESPSTMMGGHELTTVYIRLNPTEFGLVSGSAAERSSRSRYEVWRFTLLDNQWIIDAEYMNNIHGHLPFYLGLVHDDSMGTSQRSVGELLEGLQDFASALMNIHIAASRSAIWGTTFYDPTMVNLKKVPQGEVSAQVAIEPTGYGKEISTGIYEMRTQLDTKQTMQDVEAVMNIISQFFPTQALPSQIASIDRAVTDQVAAVQQGANRRQQKTARLIDDTVFRNVRFSMYYNIIQYQPDDEELVDFYTGQKVRLELSKLRQTNLPYIIGQGLKAIDRSAAAQMLQSVIFALIQAPQAQQGPDGSRIDILGLIDYWTSMIDIDIDMKQFRIAPPAPAQNPDGTPADPAAAAAAATGVQPATNPAEFTTPIFGSAPQ